MPLHLQDEHLALALYLIEHLNKIKPEREEATYGLVGTSILWILGSKVQMKELSSIN